MIAKLPRGSKRWWKCNRRLLNKKSRKTSIPSLCTSGKWHTSPVDKADALMSTFAGKSDLPSKVGNVEVADSECTLPRFLLIRRRWVLKLLRNLDVDTATGPDGLPARILRECAAELAMPICKLSRGLLKDGVWPTCWKLHWVHPLFKKRRCSCPVKLSRRSSDTNHCQSRRAVNWYCLRAVFA